ncbi:MAG TPA: pitrilysin family protein [Vicinamibacterales bacterium]|nr:pitrilysin family protein [Vicinamibacterales bacterium]
MKTLVAALVLSAVVTPASAQNRNWPSEAPPRPLPARESTFPAYELRTLDNGLQVMAVLHHEQPVVSMRMIVRAGAALDPRDKLGLADLTASLLDQGTASRSARQVQDEIDFMGGAMGAGAGTDLTFVNVIVMKDSFESGLRILSDMARQPGFAPEEIERQRQQALSTLRVNFGSPEFIADAVFDRLVYGVHPYGLPQNGTAESLPTITRADLVAFHDKYFVPNNAILAVVGDVTAEEAFASVQRVFGDWQKRDLPATPFLAPPDPARRVVVVNKPDAVQTEVRAGHLGIKRNHQDYMALNMTLRILGGEGANRLHQVLRTERGLTYGAKADMDTLLEAGDFEASTNTRSEATGEVLRLIVDEFWRIRRERVGERELSDAKAYLTGSFPLTIETPDAIATQVLNVLFYGLPVEQLQSFRDRVNAVRTDDIERVARYYLQPDRLAIVLVGNAAAFLSQLKGLGFNNVEVIEMNDLDLMAGDLRKAGSPARPTAAPAGPARRAVPGATLRTVDEPASAYQPAGAQSVQRPAIAAEDGARAREVLDRVVAAKGGADRLRMVRSIVVTTRARALGRNAPPEPADTTTYIEYPNHVRVESRIRGSEVIQVFDGSRAWVKDPNGVHDVPERMLRDFQNGLRRDTISVLLGALDGQVRVRRLPDVKDDTGEVRQALEFSSADLDPMVMYVDSATGLVTRQTYVAGGMGQPLVEESFTDFRDVDGVRINFSASVRVGGEPALERTVSAVKIGGALDPSLFKRPAP